VLQSGFTAIALQPNSFPIVDNQAQVNFVQNKAMEVLPNFSQLWTKGEV
jgi:hypothetical protein